MYIYCYENQINSKKYIGQTNNIERRKREHLSSSYNVKNDGYNSAFHRAIRKYGIENFFFSILEECDEEKANEREQYWIQEKNSYIDNHGYNLTLGGDGNKKISKFSEETIKEIQTLLQSKVDYDIIVDKYSISKTVLSNINQGLVFKRKDLIYPLCKYYKTDEDYEYVIYLLTQTSLTFREIAEEVSMGESTIKKFNYGKLRAVKDYDYPIRKKNSYQLKSEKIINLLKNTSLSQSEISKRLECSLESVRRANYGLTNRNPDLKYPIRQF